MFINHPDSIFIVALWSKLQTIKTQNLKHSGKLISLTPLHSKHPLCCMPKSRPQGHGAQTPVAPEASSLAPSHQFQQNKGNSRLQVLYYSSEHQIAE